MSLVITTGQLTDSVAAPGKHCGCTHKGIRHTIAERDENKREQQHDALQGNLGTGNWGLGLRLSRVFITGKKRYLPGEPLI